jgi:hypothetical protein
MDERLLRIGKYALLALLLTLIVFVFFNVPAGKGESVQGVLIQGLYINPRLEPPYTRLKVRLNNNAVVEATGPPNIQIRNNEAIVIIKQKRLLTSADVFKFSHYEHSTTKY